MLALIFFRIIFFIIKCNSNVTNLLVLVMHDVQYDAIMYESKTIWIFIFANHKGTT